MINRKFNTTCFLCTKGPKRTKCQWHTCKHQTVPWHIKRPKGEAAWLWNAFIKMHCAHVPYAWAQQKCTHGMQGTAKWKWCALKFPLTLFFYVHADFYCCFCVLIGGLNGLALFINNEVLMKIRYLVLDTLYIDASCIDEANNTYLENIELN